MKILHVLYSGLGGHGNVFFSMTDADDANAHEFEALFNGVEEVREEYVERCSKKNIPWTFVKKKQGLDIGYYLKLYRQIKKAEPQIIFLHGGAAAIPARLAKMTTTRIKKIIVRETQANHLKTKIDWLYLATAMLVADTMVYLSTAYQQQVKAKLSFLYSEKRTAVIPNGINLDVFKPAEKVVEPFIKIGMQSRLSDNKDHTTLIHAFASLILDTSINKPLKLYIAGDGVCRTALEKQVQGLNIGHAVEFTGMLEESELPAFINSLDIYIHATLGETMSTAIMQVMACRVPVIASDVLGVNNMIKHNENGLLVPVKNAEKLNAAMVKLINNPGTAAILANNAFTFAGENYSNKKMLQGYNLIFTA